MLSKIFFSIADSQELIFVVPRNAPDLECLKFAYSDQHIRLPAVVGFFGSNASGKSTTLRALVSAIAFACNSFDWGNDIHLLFQPYRRKDWWGEPTKITIEFDSKLSEDSLAAKFRYELHVAHKANNLGNKVISYEALSYSPQGRFRCLFERKNQEFYFGHEFNISHTSDRIQSIRPDASIISTLAKLNHPVSVYLRQQIGTLQTNFMGVFNIQKNPHQRLLAYANDKFCLERLNQELRRFDVGLESITIEQGPQGMFAKCHHTGLDNFIFLEEESKGTQHFIEIFPRLHYALEKGSIAVIDELDADLHPLLLPELFRWFCDSERNPHGAQLLFTAHNPALLDNLEKEQVFFTEKLSGQPTRVYSATEIKGLRREPSLMKKYLSGELGAVPHIG